MRHNRLRILVFSLCALFAGAFFRGCAPVAPEPPIETSVPTPAPAPTPSPTPMPTPEPVRQITDMAGRSVTLPAKIESALGADAAADVFLYTLSPEKMAGWSAPVSARTVSKMPEEYADLPVYGSGEGLDAEKAARGNARAVVMTGGPEDATQAEALQAALGVPVLVISGKLADTPDAYRLLGAALDEEARAGRLAVFSQRELNRALWRQPEERVTVYYGSGEHSLIPAPVGGAAAEVIELAGGENVAVPAADVGYQESGYVSLDGLVQWDPSVMFVGGDAAQGLDSADAAEDILYGPAFLTISAAKSGRVYADPDLPFSRLSDAGGPNRVVGLSWVSALLYPELSAEEDLAGTAEAFYGLFYRDEFSPAQALPGGR